MIDINREVQVIGVAYNYQVSKAMRNSLTKDLSAHHSAKYGHFSYFRKANSLEELAATDEKLRLRSAHESHWYEPELAMILGEEHEIVGYLLANDLTAADIEMLGRSKNFDGTHYGKMWAKSGSLGPRVISAEDIDVDSLDIGLRIERDGKVAYDNTYNTTKKKFNFDRLAGMILELHSGFDTEMPDSKRIKIEDRSLPAGTIIMTGTGIITPKRFYAQEGDIVTVYCKEIGELKNEVSF
jgi:fumarylacetoacetate (FAA) hydrolase family protein